MVWRDKGSQHVMGKSRQICAPVAMAVLAAMLTPASAAAQAQESAPATPPPTGSLRGFQLPPADSARDNDVQGPSNNGLAPREVPDRRPQPVAPPTIAAVPVVAPGEVERSPEAPSVRSAQMPPATRDRGADPVADRNDRAVGGAPPASVSRAPLESGRNVPAPDSSLILPPIAARVNPATARPVPLSPVAWALPLALLLLGSGYWWFRRRPAVATGPTVPTAGASRAAAPVAPPKPGPGNSPAASAPPPTSVSPANHAVGALVTRVDAERRAELVMALDIERLAMTPTHLVIGFALHLTNRGGAAATGAMVRIALQQAAADQDVPLGHFFDGVGGSLIRDEIEIAAGASDGLSGEAHLPRDRIAPLMIGGKPMLVPVLAFDVTYHWDGTGAAFGQTASAFVVGRELGGHNSRLGPLRLDQADYIVTPASVRATSLQRTL